ncbi:hypothetical protein FQR65_LT07366 [Abscondita terminalis]|nr:hypothetical protein FQR65_LT07366 [Abscondita terminalis]
MAVNYTELNLAREIIPQYEGGSKNLSYYIQQCEKFINTYKVNIPGQEQCSLNKLVFELCCSKLTGTARETLIVSNCATWAQVKTTLLNRFGDQRNETLLENDLITCYQFSNEIYEQYYERLKSKLQQILEHINIREENVNIKTFKKQMYEQRAQNTFCAGLLEPYRSFISNKTIASLEDALTQLRNYDNHQQQVSFLNFIRHKQPSQFSKQTSHQTKQPLKSTQIQKPSHSYNYQQPSLNMRFSHHSNQFPRGPINIQSRPIQSNFPTNSQVFGKKPEFKPTPMSVNTRNTFQSNRNQNQPQLQRNHFQQTGPRNFTSEELYNVEQSDNNEHKSEYFEDVSTLNQSFENFNTNISCYNYYCKKLLQNNICQTAVNTSNKQDKNEIAFPVARHRVQLRRPSYVSKDLIENDNGYNNK